MHEVETWVERLGSERWVLELAQMKQMWLEICFGSLKKFRSHVRAPGYHEF